MKQPSQSYLKVHYELRPAKQVERRLLADAFQSLSIDGFPIRDYKYTGMGSIYFIDFMLFHRLLGIKSMLSVEYDTQIERRVNFNKPFECVETKIGPIGEEIPNLSQAMKHLLWLDYDDILTESHLADFCAAATYLTPGSILLMTVDLEPPTDDDEPAEWLRYFSEQANEYLDKSLGPADFAKSLLPKRNIEIIERAIKAGLTGRQNIRFIPMFNFLYQDGHQMLTIGGMIGTNNEQTKLQTSTVAQADYFRSDFQKPPCVINVPRLTRKERQYLDGFMPCVDNWVPPDFELAPENVHAYRQIYRFCPTYAELLL